VCRYIQDVLFPLVSTKAKLVETLGEGAKGAPDAAAVAGWLESNVSESTRKSVEYVATVGGCTT
jgi:hypothetical protein